MGTFRHLPPERIHELHAAVIAHNLAAQQTALLAGLDPAFVSSIPDEGPPAERLLTTLYRLNSVERIGGGTIPIQHWLENAVSLTRGASDLGDNVFADALAELREPLAARPLPPARVEAQPMDPRAAKIRALSMQREELASQGEPTEAIVAELLRLKREQHEGIELAAHHTLSGGRFEFLEHLGRGRMGTVWKAFDHETGRHVAVKIMLADHGPAELARFRRGARYMARLDHPNIVRVAQAVSTEAIGGAQRWFFVMEHLPGGNLNRAVLERRWPPEEALRRVVQAGRGLARAHEEGVVHRDVSPDNILLTADGTAKLTDFDLVRAADTTGLTKTGNAVGKFLYLAPELFAGAEAADARSDVHALGITAIFAVHGRALPHEVVSNRERFISRLGCSHGLKEALRRATDGEPDGRYASVSDFCEEIERALSDRSERMTPTPTRAVALPALASVERERANADATEPVIGLPRYLELSVRRTGGTNDRAYCRFDLRGHSDFLSAPVRDLVELAADAARILVEYCLRITELMALAGERTRESQLRRIGMMLGESLLPAPIRRILAGPFPEGTPLLIESDDAWIPWEAVVIGDDASGFFLGERFAVTRWMRQGLFRSEIARGPAVLVAPEGSGLDSGEEREALRRITGTEPRRVGDLEAVQDHLSRSAPRLAFLHFACHGLADPNDPLTARLKLDDDDLRPVDVSFLDYRDATGPLMASCVFLNACDSDISGRRLSGHAGWAEIFLAAGAAAVIVPAWSIGDRVASGFSTRFYAALEEGAAVSAAVRAARNAVRSEGDPDRLAYAVYAAPWTRLAPKGKSRTEE